MFTLSATRRLPRGVTLGEAIIAVFVLVTSMVVSASLYHAALQHSVRIDRKQRAARVAAQRIEEIRSWSRKHHGTNGDLEFTEGWGTFNGAVTTDPDNPGYEVTTVIEEQRLFSPSSEFETIGFAAMEDENIPDPDPDVPVDPNSEGRQLGGEGDSSRMAIVTVTWGPSVSERVVTRTLITDPVRDHGYDNENIEDMKQAVSMEFRTSGAWGTSAPSVLPVNGRVHVRAFVKDASGDKVDNAAIQWYVDPDCTGNGILESRANQPDRATFTNQYIVDPDPGAPGGEITVHTGGFVRLIARVRLGGVEIIKETPRITLLD